MKNIRKSIVLFFIFPCFVQQKSQAQVRKYTMENVHSHNDYLQKKPFFDAYKYGVGSIEADIYLRNDSLIVSHMENEMSPDHLLEKMYLDPINEKIKENVGSTYKDKNKKLNLLIDLKSEASSTLDTLIKHLNKYPALINCPTLTITITGNQPPENLWTKYPDYIYFDGHLNVNYNAATLPKINMFSANFADFIAWGNNGNLEVSKSELSAVVDRIHALKKKIRFWGIPDNITTWKNVESLDIDYLNTDHIEPIFNFIEEGK